jgi:hypothetical protein
VQLYDKVLYNLIKYIEGGRYFNLMDLEEFKNLDPKIKEQYRKYVVDVLMKNVTDQINKGQVASLVAGEDLNEYISGIQKNVLQ